MPGSERRGKGGGSGRTARGAGPRGTAARNRHAPQPRRSLHDPACDGAAMTAQPAAATTGWVRDEPTRLVVEALKEGGVDFVASLPDTWLGEIANQVAADPGFQ